MLWTSFQILLIIHVTVLSLSSKAKAIFVLPEMLSSTISFCCASTVHQVTKVLSLFSCVSESGLPFSSWFPSLVFPTILTIAYCSNFQDSPSSSLLEPTFPVPPLRSYLSYLHLPFDQFWCVLLQNRKFVFSSSYSKNIYQSNSRFWTQTLDYFIPKYSSCPFSFYTH